MAIGRGLSVIFGSFTISYTKPAWISGLGAALASAGSAALKPVRSFLSALSKAKKAKPVLFRGIAGGIGFLVVCAIAVFIVFSLLPKPETIRARIAAPGTPEIGEEETPLPLVIEFGGSAAKLDEIGRRIMDGITIEPDVAGVWFWETERRIVFTPGQEWPIGAEFRVAMDRDLFPDHVLLDSYSLRFKTDPFSAKIVECMFYIDPTDQTDKRIVATIEFTHPVNKDEFGKAVTLSTADRSQSLKGYADKLEIKFDKYFRTAYVTSGRLPVPEKDLVMRLNVSASYHPAGKGPQVDTALGQDVTIPGYSTYAKIDSAELVVVRNEQYTMDQVLAIETTGETKHEYMNRFMSAYLLPKDMPERPGVRKDENHSWYEQEVDASILALSEKLELAPVPTEKEYSSLLSYKYKAAPGRFVYLKLGKGVRFYGDYVLADEYRYVLEVPQIPKELKILHDGSILSLSGEKKLSLMAHDVENVMIEIGRIIPDQINHLISQTEGDFRNPYFTSYNFGKENISEMYTETRRLAKLGTGEVQFFSFDFSSYLARSGSSRLVHGLFFFNVREYRPGTEDESESYSYTDVRDYRLVLVTDLGIVMKRATDESCDIFVQSVSAGTPVYGASVDIMGKNGIPVLTATTDADGRAHFPPVKGFSREKTPVAFVIEKGDDLSYLPFDAEDRLLNFSRFDIGGLYGTSDPKRLEAFLFSDRGLYRPGDNLRMGIIVKTRDWKRIVSPLPMEAVITDSRGVAIHKTPIKLSPLAYEEISYDFGETAPTGTYKVDLFTIGKDDDRTLIGTTNVKVEEFQPDRMNVSVQIPAGQNRAWVRPENIVGRVTLRNLYGTPAEGNRVEGKMFLSPKLLDFPQFPGYQFYDPFKSDKRFNEDLEETKTNKEGIAEFQIDLSRFKDSTFSLTFAAIAYEKQGGRGVSSETTIVVSPLDYLVGYKPDGNLGYIYKGSERNVHFITVGPAMQKIAVRDLALSIENVRYVSVLTRQENGTFKYQSVEKKTRVRESAVGVAADGLNYRLPTDEPGEFELTLSNKAGTRLAAFRYSVVGQGNIARNLERNAELQVKLDKTDYTPGETIQVYMIAPYTGAGLITIERERVFAYKWFTASTNASTQTITVPEELEGNAYVSVAFVRSIDSREIYMSPLSYGAVPFFVSKERRTNTVTLDVPQEARPGKPFVIGYSAAKPGKIVVYAVDQGILQVAKYSMPDPLSHFFTKRALEVSTQQILDLILPEYSIVQELSAMGGSEESDEIGKHLNPFKRKRDKPVAFWSGIIDVDRTTRSVSYDIPDYFNGTLKVMAVAVSEDTIGVASKSSLVRDYFVINPSAPFFTVPDDEFEIGVNVSNNVKGSGAGADVRLDISVSQSLLLQESASKTIRVPEGSDGIAYFKVRVTDSLGEGSFTIKASYKNYESKSTSTMSIRPALPYRTEIATGTVRNAQVDVKITRGMYADFRTLSASVSYLPLGMTYGLSRYLEKFPYGCTEQVVSMSFPHVVLRETGELGFSSAKSLDSFGKTIAILRIRQNADGAFGIWAANEYTDPFVNAYAIHYLTEARESGFPVPDDMLRRSIASLERMLSAHAQSINEARVQAYATYVLTRNGVITTPYINRLRKDLEKIRGWKEDLTACFLAGAYALLKMNGEAASVSSDVKPALAVPREQGEMYDPLFTRSAFLYVISKHLFLQSNVRAISDSLVTEIFAEVAGNDYNTLSASFASMALAAYIKATGLPSAGQVAVSEVFAKNEAKTLTLSGKLFQSADFSPAAQAIRVQNKTDANLFYQTVQAGFDLELPTSAVKEKIEIVREYTDSKGNLVKEVRMGDEIEVHIKVRMTDAFGKGIGNVAIVDLLPAGFEAILKSFPDRGDDTPATVNPSLDPDFTDVREDRVVIYCTAKSSVTEFAYKLRATCKGTYLVPPAFAESMYDGKIRACGMADTISVTE